MNIAKELKLDIIEILFKVDDVGLLTSIRRQLELVDKVEDKKEIPAFMEGITTIRESVSLADIMAEQNYQPITYQRFRAKANELEWDNSLEELLTILKK